MKNRTFSPFLDVKWSAEIFEKALRTSLQYFESMQSHSASGYSERLYKFVDWTWLRQKNREGFPGWGITLTTSSKFLLKLEAKVKCKQGTSDRLPSVSW